MNSRSTIIEVLRNIASDKGMLRRSDYWALICGEAAELLEADAAALQKPREPVSCGKCIHFDTRDSTGILAGYGKCRNSLSSLYCTWCPDTNSCHSGEGR